MKLWVVGQTVDDDEWQLTGVFDSEEQAVRECRDTSYFVGPVELNEAEHNEVDWEGVYYPIEEVAA